MTRTLLGSPVRVGSSRDDVLGQAAEAVRSHLEASSTSEANTPRGACLVVSAGATTPLVLQRVATSWTQSWLPIVLLSDERHSTVAGERNDEAVRRVLRDTPFDGVRIVAPPVGTDLADAARIWAQAISSLPQPIVALVSMADDGHVAGLFADCRYESVSDSVVVTRESPKAPSQRISLSAEFLRAIPHRIAVVTGSQKLHVLARLHKESVVPIAGICPSEWFTDSLVPE